MSCENCKNECKPVDGVQTELTAPAVVPLFAVEGQAYRREKTLRGTVIVFCVALLVIALLVGLFGFYAYQLHVESLNKVEAINKYWLDFISEYEFEGYSYEYTQDGKGLNIIGDNNGVNGYGPESESDDPGYAPEER